MADITDEDGGIITDEDGSPIQDMGPPVYAGAITPAGDVPTVGKNFGRTETGDI